MTERDAHKLDEKADNSDKSVDAATDANHKPSSWFAHEKALVETTSVGEGTRIWAFAHVMAKVILGKNCNVGDHAFIESNVTIGDSVTVKNGVCIFEGVHIADKVFVGPKVVFTNDKNPRSRAAGWKLEETWVEQCVSIGANSTIVCGVRLGHHCLIGAGSVVTRDVPPHALVVGNPARQRGWVCVCGHVLKPGQDEITECDNCTRVLKISKQGVVQVDS